MFLVTACVRVLSISLSSDIFFAHMLLCVSYWRLVDEWSCMLVCIVPSTSHTSACVDSVDVDIATQATFRVYSCVCKTLWFAVCACMSEGIGPMNRLQQRGK